MKRTILTYLAAGALLLVTACNSDDSVEQATEQTLQQFEAAGVQNMEDDVQFVTQSASASMLQIQLSEAALERGVSPEVKTFAEKMVRDHRTMLAELQNTADQSRIMLPQTLGKADQEVYDNITAKQGIGFDVEYIKAMAGQHKNLLGNYEDIAEDGINMDVKQYASKQLPVIRQHLDKIEQLKEKVD
jgi:putative membrane protein